MPTVHAYSSIFKRVFASGFVLLIAQFYAIPAAPAVMSHEIRKKQIQGSAFFNDSKWKQAIALYTEVLTAYPKEIKTRVYRGICYCRIRDYKNAIDDFNTVLKFDHDSISAYQHLGYVYYKLGDYPKAIADCTRAIELSPSNRFAFRDRAKAYAKIGKLDLAQKDFAVQQRLDGIDRSYKTAVELQQKGQYTRALDVFKYTLKQEPGLYNPNYRRACIYSKLGMYDEAIQVCSEYIKRSPKTLEGRRLRAINYLQIGEFDKAIADADVGLKADPDVPDLYYVKARAATYKKNYPQAIANYSAIIKLKPVKELQARMERADAYTELGDYKKAIDDYDLLAKSEPNDETIFHHRANVYLKMHDYDKAIADLQNFVRLAPKDSLALMSLGDGLYQAHRDLEAVKAYSKAIELDATSPTLFESRAKTYERCKNSACAKQDLEKARALRESD